MAKVSVVIPSYNHERFVSQSIRSALEQTTSDLEVIVVDDGSLDGSVKVIEAIDDPRLRLVTFPENIGAAEATNRGILEATGEFIAILNSDDAWVPNKIEQQLSIFEKRPDLGAVFSWAQFVDESDQPINPEDLPFGRVFEEGNRSRGLWLRRFLLQSNCLCHPSVLVRRDVYDKVGLYDERFRQLPDFDMWIRVCSLYDIHVIPQPLVRFRFFSGERNTSSNNKANNQRMLVENMLIAEKFFDRVDLNTFIDGFGDICIASEIQSEKQRLIEQAFLLACNRTDLGKAYKPVGIRRLYELLGDPAAEEILRDVYRFGAKQFHELSGKSKLPVIG